ncbi:hypothetical protein TEA_000476 [Camellia sinensis var. sinensis]|uniref:Protein kinase domain-containing protein n=1 Tax=Camellia sinensis var. sinensis TaxID=542762 RepID=A0A4V3WKH1_CAMSN|nr:hypothetical protein TEA_000476 [Camellia sinensis var. sinensis]
MTVEEVKAVKRKNIVVGIKIDGHSRELLNWALVKVAETGDHVVAIHVCSDSDSTSKNKPLLDEYLQVYEGLCNAKKVDLTGDVLTGSSIQKVLVREAKNLAAESLIVGIRREFRLGTCWFSVAKYCAKRLPQTTDILAIYNGKVVYRRSSSNRLPGREGDPKPSFYLVRDQSLTDNQSEFGDSETSETPRHSHEVICNSRNDSFNSPVQKHKKFHSSSFSFVTERCPEERPGWPLLRIATAPVTQPAAVAKKLSVAQWVMSLPNRPPPKSPQSKAGFSSIELENSLMVENLDKLIKTNSSGRKWLNYNVIKTSTSQFSSDKLIGNGGYNRVYKGLLPGGKPVAVKVLKSSKEAWKDFTQEVDIMSSLKHKNITPLLGICVEDNELISVYDFLSGGNLEENLHGNSKKTSVLSWELRFKLAVEIAEALNYLHNECSRPVIHRDVKSSNILLSNEFEPKVLSDFGLAIWGPSDSSFLTDNDVVGTFGYLAPEYFMYGKVSDKVDVYSFGVVLLELLSGRKAITFDADKGQESLVMWAKLKLETGNLRSTLDLNLEGNIDETQIQRMGLAARLCLTRSARLRPKMSQVLEILNGKTDVDEWLNTRFGDQNEAENQDNTDDEVYPHLKAESHLGLALLDVEETTPSFNSMERSSKMSLEEYLKERLSSSSSLD